MQRILITGATGNVGRALIRELLDKKGHFRILAGVRSPDRAKELFPGNPNPEWVKFDLEDPSTFGPALANADLVFLLRPPHISDVGKYFEPLIAKMKELKISGLVFLSVQGAEKSKFIPHHKIEKLILDSGLNYIFLRPSYFMQNLVTTLLPDIREYGKIIVPAAGARFNWVDIEDIAKVSACLLTGFQSYMNRSYEITGPENLDFQTVTDLINCDLKTKITYYSPGPLAFYRLKRRQGIEKGMILVLIMLHFLPRFKKEPGISGVYTEITGRPSTRIEEFIRREINAFEI